MRIAGVDFPQTVLDAFEEGKLVVFAGAGVSMGSPAGLPDFSQLANQVASGRSESKGSGETEDQFLGRLHDKQVDVYSRVAEILRRNDPEPTELHGSLLRLYGKQDEVKIVTTNFDDLFEKAAPRLWDSVPEVFKAPAFPLGSSCEGIVHLHGWVHDPKKMVLTHKDFGRAYLTESDGWARRFLKDLFSSYVVLFVGYSHQDTIMKYFTPSLPPEDSARRFAMVGDVEGKLDHWASMGIEPILFHQEHEHDYAQLSAALAGLAQLMRRGLLDWQRDINRIAGGLPPIDEESAAIIDHALASEEHARFFTYAAVSPDWIQWLDRRGHLNKLFDDGELSAVDGLLSHWLAGQFAASHADELFFTIASHGGKLNPQLWQRFAWSLGQSRDEPPDKATISRWVHLLMSSGPTDVDDFTLMSLAKLCSELKQFLHLLQIYDAITASRYQIRPGYDFDRRSNHQYWMQDLWTESLEPHLQEIVEPLLERTTWRLMERHSLLRAWDQSTDIWDSDSWHRSAIEPHAQDETPGQIDALIDVARECLEWLGVHEPAAAKIWSERSIKSEVPLLRRVAIHAMAARTDISESEKITWLLERYDVNDLAAHHEIFQAVGNAYPLADQAQRAALIQAVSEYQAPKSENYDSRELAAHHRFVWFHWLHEADPDCTTAKDALDVVWTTHPEFQAPQHAAFTHWMEISSPTSPWTADMLLGMAANDALENLLNYQPGEEERFEGHHRWAMLRAVGEAVRRDTNWAIALADAIASRGEWDTDLWGELLMGWQQTEFEVDEVARILDHLKANELQERHADRIADILSQMVQNVDAPVDRQWLQECDDIATALQQYVPNAQLPPMTASVDGEPRRNWLNRAINHLSGRLALYWIHSISRSKKQQEEPAQGLSDEHRQALQLILEDDTEAGKLGRTVLASQLSFMLFVDRTWAEENLLPLFDAHHADFECAWDGFLAWGQLSPPIAEVLQDQIIGATEQIQRLSDRDSMMRFTEYYVAALGWLITGADDRWITQFFRHADPDSKRFFASDVDRRLRNLDEAQQKEWWNTWVRDYWGNRLQGVPAALDIMEIGVMLEWVLHLPGVFQEAVAMAVGMPQGRLEGFPILREIRESDLATRYPNELAEFLVHIGRYETVPWFWRGTRSTIDELLECPLHDEIRQGLRELAAKYELGE